MRAALHGIHQFPLSMSMGLPVTLTMSMDVDHLM
jgi:hypothetical protein